MTILRATEIEDPSRILGEGIRGPETANISFLPIALDGLRPGTVLGFQLLLRDGEHYLPFHARAALFTDRERRRLLDLKLPTVFISREDLPRYQAYIVAHIDEIVRDETIPERAKAGIVYRSTQGLVREILSRPDDPRTVDRSRKAASTAVDYILRGREAFLELVTTCSYDYQTFTHSVNVCIFSVALARQAGFSPEELPEIGAGVLLHDIGKARVDPAILNKTSRLTEEEWEVMRKHPRWGSELVQGQPGLTPLVRDLILHHHEKLDGSGYPDGLRGEDLSPAVRITTLCDMFDALTTSRSYKAALSTFDTLALIQRQQRGRVDESLLREFILLLRAGSPR